MRPISETGKLWQSPCPMAVHEGRVTGGTIPRFTEGKLRPETCVSGSHRQSRTRAPGSHPDPAITWDLVSSARWGKGERRPTVKETHPAGSDWRRTLVLAPPPRLPVPRVQGPISRVPGSAWPLPISRTTPQWPLLPPLAPYGSLSARLRMPRSRKRANGKSCMHSGKCSLKPGELGKAVCDGQ